jgi:enoyl-CoA hydratase
VSRAMDMILTGRPVSAAEALDMGLANRLVPDGESRPAAEALARELAALPQTCMRQDRLSLLEQEGLDEAAALANELGHGIRSLEDARDGLERFRAGAGRHGVFDRRTDDFQATARSTLRNDGPRVRPWTPQEARRRPP